MSRCSAALASSASERVRLLPRRVMGTRMLVAAMLWGSAKRGAVSIKQPFACLHSQSRQVIQTLASRQVHGLMLSSLAAGNVMHLPI